ncbi:hypothetical protein QVD17_34949 [Tagetes erecta]|uniref:Uncharacterized protein n=1 Tax=Tagetes erecta TaxID=13708 RepID=A0AAD8NM46_TARER|nr:hypothetical protein QVD17_34949 [Tagetes erecta]
MRSQNNIYPVVNDNLEITYCPVPMSSQTPLDPTSFLDTPNQFGLLPEEQVVDNWILDQLPSTYPQETLEPWTNFCEEPNTWNFTTPPAPLKIQKTIPFGEGTSRSRKPRIRIHPIQEKFSYSLKDIEEANLEVDKMLMNEVGKRKKPRTSNGTVSIRKTVQSLQPTTRTFGQLFQYIMKSLVEEGTHRRATSQRESIMIPY